MAPTRGSRCAASPLSRAERRPLLGDLERALRADGEAQHPDLARQREHGDAERGDREQRDASPIASHASADGSVRGTNGSAANAAASSAARATASAAHARPAPKHPHGAPARPAASAASSAARRRAGTARRRARRVEPAATPGERELDAISAPPREPPAAEATAAPYVANAARADGPPAAFSPAAATSTSPRTRQTTTETIDAREGNSIA